jgi:mono/diheme cytochrome c family protein
MNRALRRSLWTGALLLALAPGWLPAAPSETPARKHWRLADFGGVLSVGLEGHRNFQEGLVHYRTLCAGCHALGKYGEGTAPELTRRALTYTPEELLGHILSDSKHANDAPLKHGLIDSLTQAGVLDLLAFVLSGADPKSPFFFNP